MIQDIMPKKLYNQYKNYTPKDEDIILFFEGSSVLGRYDKEEIIYPNYRLFCSCINKTADLNGKSNANTVTDARRAVGKICVSDEEHKFTFRYLLSVDNERFFLAIKNDEIQHGEFSGEMSDSRIHSEYKSFIEGIEFIGVNSFRRAKPKYKAFAVITAYHLYGWYRDNHFCGRCGKPLKHDDKQRMLRCDCCKNMVFPKICPAVIVAVTDKDRILLTKYAGRTYRNYALIAGFTEIGETTEETVSREVMEEVGVKVKNITYYKSQPWGLSGSQLLGYFCELDGDDTITLEEDELSVGTWVKADDIDVIDDHISLTREMIEKFRSEHVSHN